MMKYIIALTILLLTSTYASSESITLNCVSEDGDKLTDVTVDIENKNIKFGPLKENGKFETFGYYFDVVSIIDNYVTAVMKSIYNNIGSEIFVINRSTGEYMRSTIYMGTTEIIKGNPEDQREHKLSSYTQNGKCTQRAF